MIIYKITNLINGKFYIGQTKQTIKQRWSCHMSSSKADKNKYILAKALRKYGFENFKIESIDDTANTQEELDNLEIKYIKEYNSIIPFGYNDNWRKRSLDSDSSPATML